MKMAKVEHAGSPARLALLAGSIIILTDATVLRVREDGTADELLPGGHPRPGCAHSTATARDGSPCPRFGGTLLALAEIAEIAARADAEIDARKLVVSDVATRGLRLVAGALRCHAGVCEVLELGYASP